MSVETEPEAAWEAGRTDASNVAAISVKIPPFWPSDPQVWFAQVEAQFSTRGITAQQTKFDYIVASLSPEFATEVRDFILQPPTTHPYATLKEQLIRRIAASEQRRFQLPLKSWAIADPQNFYAEYSSYWATELLSANFFFKDSLRTSAWS